MNTSKNLLIGALLSTVAAVSFAQAPTPDKAAVMKAPAATTAPAAAEPAADATKVAAAKPAAKKKHKTHAKKAKPVKAAATVSQ